MSPGNMNNIFRLPIQEIIRTNNTQIHPYFFILLILLTACGQESKKTDKEVSNEKVAKEIIEKSGTCTLITLDISGQPKARVMDPFPPTEDFVIWFGTNQMSRKVGEIKNDQRVTVHYYDKPSAAYVSLYGNATIINDPELKKTYWKSSWADFYPDYPNSYSLIKFIPERIELISEAHGITGDPKTWKPDTVNFNWQTN